MMTDADKIEIDSLKRTNAKLEEAIIHLRRQVATLTRINEALRKEYAKQ